MTRTASATDTVEAAQASRIAQAAETVAPVIRTTKEALLEAGKVEFMELGFERASLRTIARRAGVTTGAIYGYYPDKAALFDALVAEPSDALLDNYLDVVKRFEELSPQDQFKNMDAMTGAEMGSWIDRIYENLDAFKLVFARSAGTRWESYLDSFISVEEESSHAFIANLKAEGIAVPTINPRMMHMLASAYFEAISEVVVHDVPREEAREIMGKLIEFFSAGWNRLLELPE